MRFCADAPGPVARRDGERNRAAKKRMHERCELYSIVFVDHNPLKTKSDNWCRFRGCETRGNSTHHCLKSTQGGIRGRPRRALSARTLFRLFDSTRSLLSAYGRACSPTSVLVSVVTVASRVKKKGRSDFETACSKQGCTES